MISDELIINGFCSFDEHITKEYFYGFCRKAYDIFDHKYQLRNKTGLDFYSLAHEYYISLMIHQFKPLLDRPNGVKLSTWMTNGFRFVILDALKAYNKEFSPLNDSSADDVLAYIRSSDYEDGMMLQVADAVASYYKKDRMMQEIAHFVFYAGYSQKDVAEMLHITPSAVNQRYKKMMDEVVTPFVIENYSEGLYKGAVYEVHEEMAEYEKAGAAPVMAPRHFAKARFCLEIPEKYMENRRITPDRISVLKPNEIFVFGSNLQGIHAGGAAFMARMHFGAVMGQGVGLQGQSYAIPTMQGGVETIKPYVDEFIDFANNYKELNFLVTRIGCGIAGFEPYEIAPLFKDATNMENVWLPEDFLDVLDK